MVSVNSNYNMTSPIGITQEKNGTNTTGVVGMYGKLATSSNPSTFKAENYHSTDFAKAIYGDGPYSLLRPNHTSDITAVNIDFVA